MRCATCNMPDSGSALYFVVGDGRRGHCGSCLGVLVADLKRRVRLARKAFEALPTAPRYFEADDDKVRDLLDLRRPLRMVR